MKIVLELLLAYTQTHGMNASDFTLPSKLIFLIRDYLITHKMPLGYLTKW
jgi:hypothetical protein